MTEEEAIQIAEYVAAACPAQRFNEYTPDVWGELLAPYTVDEARSAAIAVARRQTFVSPAEIITEIRDRRAERIAAANLVYDGNPLETGAQFATSLRALLAAAADGHTPPQSIRTSLGTTERPALPAGTPTTGRAAAVLAAVGQAVPRTRDGVVNPRAVACRRCSALPGTSCTTNGKRRADAHPARLDDARRIAAGLPPVDPDAALLEETRIREASAAALAKQPATATADHDEDDS
ncbi:hypothetical protein [Streptomyces sp. NPDC059015]|uniref:zinc finger domain-containing protein n=1 Tax=unclassified Streptomyces TaxID=2593676 RepID=UPI0036C26601